jgi:hypothetical protein
MGHFDRERSNLARSSWSIIPQFTFSATSVDNVAAGELFLAALKDIFYTVEIIAVSRT